jgi:hypothetical protein
VHDNPFDVKIGVIVIVDVIGEFDELLATKLGITSIPEGDNPVEGLLVDHE